MYKNQLQELAQRSCFNLPSYACIREGPDHAPRFKASVNFNGEVFESPTYTTTLRKAEHSAAQVALNVLSTRGPSNSLTARILDETGVHKNLLQITAHRAGVKQPVYTSVRSGPGHAPVFTCSVEIANMNFTGEPAKTKKQAEKNAAIAAWSSLKTKSSLASLVEPSGINADNLKVEQYHNTTRGRRDQNQAAGRRIQKGSLLMLDSCSLSEVSSRTTCATKYSTSFVSQLPPPPKPRATSKILQLQPSQLSVTTRPKPESFQVPLLDEHQRREDGWLNNLGKSTPTRAVYGGSSNFTSRAIAFLIPDQTHDSEIKRGLAAGPPPTLPPLPPPPPPPSSSKSLIESAMYIPQRVAPAVQMRSVIPVCAAPIRPTQMALNPPLVKEAASASASVLPSFKHAEVSSELLNATTLASTSIQ